MHPATHLPTLASHTIAWEECPCLLCGSATHTPVLEAADSLGILRFLVVRCTRCGLCFTNPRPDLNSIKQFYPADYRCHHGNTDPERQRGYGRAPRWFTEISSLAVGVRRPRLLDFGCGAGGYLRRLHSLGWSVTGLDLAEDVVARIRANGLDAHVGTLPNSRWTEPCFEAITMWQSLEHVHQPLDVLRAAHRLLTTGGKLLVATPNFDSVASRWFGASWHGLDLPRHLTHFTPATLRRMLVQAEFDDVQLRQERRSSWVRHSAAMTHGFRARLLGTRLGSGAAGWWGLLTRRADSLIAIATKH